MRHGRLYIEDTELGWGVFAGDDIAADELIGEVLGEVIDDPDYGSDYCIDLGGDRKLEPESPFRYLNHSCDPNCQIIRWKTRRVNGRRCGRLWLEAVRPVRRGEQLTVDYAWPAEMAIACRCQSRNCRGWIVHPDQRADLPQPAGGPRDR